MPQLQASVDELSHNPLSVISHVAHEPVAIMMDNQTVFYCVNAQEFLEFLAFKKQKHPTKPKKSIHAFAGVFKDKTPIKLSIDEMNEAIEHAGQRFGSQGMDTTHA